MFLYAKPILKHKLYVKKIIQLFSVTNLFHKGFSTDHNPQFNDFILVNAKFDQFVSVELIFLFAIHECIV